MQKQLSKAVSLILAILMLLSTTVTAASPSDYSDFPTDWSTEALTAAVDNNILQGYGDGKIGPNETLKRAEMAAIINRILGAVIPKDINGVFTDVNTTDWFYQDIAKAVNACTINGCTATQMNPNNDIRREDAILILSRVMLLSEPDDLSCLDRFTDKSDIDSWAIHGFAGMVKAGYINGYSDGKLLPRGNITRAEFAQILHNIFKKYITKEGTYSEVPTKGSVVINVPGVILKGITIDGDLIIGDGVGEGTLTLENVIVKGRIIFRGAGSVTLKNVTVDGKVIINNINNIVKFNNYKSDKAFKNIEYITGATFLKQESSGGGGGGSIPTPSKAAYKTIYYQQNPDNNNYTQIESDTRSSLVGTIVSAVIKTYEGFTENTAHADRLVTGTVVSGGSLILKVFYNRNLYTAAFNTDGGSAVASKSVKYGAKIEKPADPTKQGYVFNGWYNGDNLWNFTSGTMPIGNLTLTAKWVPSSTVTYKVEHYWQNADDGNYKLYETIPYTNGTTGQTVNAAVQTYTGLTVVTKPETIASGVVLADGSRVLKLYYDRNVNTVTYNTNGGSSIASQSVKFGAKVNKPSDPTKQGYEFGSWENGINTWDFTNDTMPNSALTLTAKWNPAKNTPYVTQLYYENTNGDYELSPSSINQTGTTDSIVSAFEIIPPVGFYENTATPLRVISGTVAPDGSLRLKRYFDRYSYTVTFDSDGGSAVTAKTVKFGAKITEPADPTKVGYTFGGWYNGDTEWIFTTDTMPNNVLTLKAKWLPATNTPYKTEFYLEKADEEGYALDPSLTISGIGTTGTTVQAAVNKPLGFTENPNPGAILSGIIAPDGSLVLKRYYDRLKTTVQFNAQNGTAYPDQIVKYGAKIIKPADPVKAGNVFNGWYYQGQPWNFDDRLQTLNAQTLLEASWILATDVSYKVEHYRQNLNDNGYTLYETKPYTDGETGKIVTAEVQTYTGFAVVTKPETIASGVVIADGSLTLKLYYDRNTNTVTFDSDGGTAVASQNVKYGNKVIKPADPTKTGFSFAGWYNGESIYDFNSVPATALTLKARWNPNTNVTYYVEQYWQNTDDNNYTLYEAKVYTDGVTGQTVNAVAQTYTGLHNNLSVSGTVSSGVIPASGTLTLKLYYDRETYDVKFYDGETLAGSSVKRYGQKAALPPEPSAQPLLAFAGWYLADNVTSITSDTVVTQALTAYAKWTDDYYTVSFYDYDTKVDEKRVAKNGTLTSLSDKIFAKTTIVGKDYVRYAVWVDKNNVLFTTSTVVTSDISLYSKFKTVGFETYIEKYDHSFMPATVYDGNTRAADAIKLMIYENESYSLTAFSELKAKAGDQIYDKNVIDSNYNILMQERKIDIVESLGDPTQLKSDLVVEAQKLYGEDAPENLEQMVGTIVDDLAGTEKQTLFSTDNKLIAEALANVTGTLEYADIEKYITPEVKSIISEEDLKTIFEDSKTQYQNELDTAAANASDDTPTGVELRTITPYATYKLNPIDDLLLPKYNKALDKLNELKAQYNVSNQAFDDLVDLLSPNNLLIKVGPETETLSGYKLLNEGDYYQILKDAVLLADTAGIEFANNYTDGTRKEYLDKAMDKFFDYLNTINKYADKLTNKFAPSYTSKDLTEEQILAKKSLLLKIILEDANITVDGMFEKYFGGVDGKDKTFKGVYGEVARWLDGDIPA